MDPTQKALTGCKYKDYGEVAVDPLAYKYTKLVTAVEISRRQALRGFTCKINQQLHLTPGIGFCNL
jgi:hypothetical protein